MNFFCMFGSKFFSRMFLAIVGSLILTSSSNLSSSCSKPDVVLSLPNSDDGIPLMISPVPGPANPDPILQNLDTVMSNFFQQPYYPGSLPFPSNYLAGITFQFNSLVGGGLAINPFNDKIMHTLFSQNAWRDATFVYKRSGGSILQGTSLDGGFTWNYGPPPEQIIPLGGTISQLVGRGLVYDKNGTLFSFWGFRTLIANPPNQVPMQGIVLQRSEDDGQTWTAPKIIVQTSVDGVFNFGVFGTGLGIEGNAMLVDPAKSNLIHVAFPSVIRPSTFYGNILYLRSKDGGKTFSTPRQIYSMVDDPVWQAEHFDPDFTTDPNYFIFGGQTLIASGSFVVVDKDVLIIPAIRVYPKIGSTIYNQQPDNSNTDRAFIRSFDNGKTWSPIAATTRQYVFPFAHDPAEPFGEFTIIVPDGGENNHTTIYSPLTGRLYTVYMAGNPAASPDPLVYQFFPYILLSASTDKGATWSDPIQINLTPTDIPIENQQAFQPAVTLTQDGSLVIAYYDFRNYTGGTDITTFLQTDVWLAVYKETSNAKGGSTGLGLDVVGEIRVSPESFNSRVLKTSAARTFSGGGEGVLNLAINNKNELLVTFTMASNQASPVNIFTGFRGMTVDTNNRANVFIRRFQFPKPSNQ